MDGLATHRFRPDRGYVRVDRLPVGPGGRALCRACGHEVEGRRKSFCSDQCVEAWRVQTQPGYARELVFRRDQGVCGTCGLDCWALEGVLTALLDDDPAVARDNAAILGFRLARIDGRWYDRLHERVRIRSLWAADHIVPVVEGGGCSGLGNFRTLCLPCHARETRALAGRRAQARRLDGRSASP